MQESQQALEQNNAQRINSPPTPSTLDRIEANKVNSISGGNRTPQSSINRSGETETTQSNNNYRPQNNFNNKNGQSNQNNQFPFSGQNNAPQNNANPILNPENNRFDNRPSNERPQLPGNNYGVNPNLNTQNNQNGGSAENQNPNFRPSNNGNRGSNQPQYRPNTSVQNNQQPPQTNSQEQQGSKFPVTKRPYNQQGSNEYQGQKFENHKPITKFAWELLKVKKIVSLYFQFNNFLIYFKVSNTPPGQNLVMCPLSPQLLLSYLALGSTGGTKNEIETAISYSKPNQIEQLIRSMLSEAGHRELQFATAFFVADNLV